MGKMVKSIPVSVYERAKRSATIEEVRLCMWLI
jgi:hypothetical protein